MIQVQHVENQTEHKHLEDKSELKKIGLIMRELGIFECESGLKLVIRNGQEIFIPQMARREMFLELHSTHMSTEGINKMARKKFRCPQMSRDIERVYEACVACKENRRSKNNVPGRRVEVVPSTMELGGPGELLCMDFGEYGRSNLLIIKDIFSGLLRVHLTKDKAAESATKGVERLSQTYGLPLQIRSNQETCFPG